MGRRRFLAIAVGVLGASLPAAVRAQQAGKIHQLGSLIYGRPPSSRTGYGPLQAGLRVSGYLAVQTPLIRARRALIAELSLKHRLAGIFGAKENVEAGGLMLYFADHLDLTRRAAAYIVRILEGARPADLPVEQASKYQLVINLKTARALGLTIPPSLLARADRSSSEPALGAAPSTGP